MEPERPDGQLRSLPELDPLLDGRPTHRRVQAVPELSRWDHRARGPRLGTPGDSLPGGNSLPS